MSIRVYFGELDQEKTNDKQTDDREIDGWQTNRNHKHLNYLKNLKNNN